MTASIYDHKAHVRTNTGPEGKGTAWKERGQATLFSVGARVVAMAIHKPMGGSELLLPLGRGGGKVATNHYLSSPVVGLPPVASRTFLF